MSANFSVIAVIPALNEAPRIGTVLKELGSYVDDVIVVDDGSSDDTGSIACKAGATVITHAQNCGPGAAPMTGFLAARSLNPNAVITLDADGQMNPKDIPALLVPLKEGKADIVFGNRFGGRNQIPTIRKLYNCIGNTLTWVATGKWVPDSQSGFKAIGNKALHEIDLQTIGFEYCSEIVRECVQHQWRVVHVPIKVVYSEYTLAKGQSFGNGVKTALKMLLRSFLR